MAKQDGWCQNYSMRQNWNEGSESSCVTNCQKRRINGDRPTGCEYSSKVGSCSAFWGNVKASDQKYDPYGNDYVCYVPMSSLSFVRGGSLAMKTPDSHDSPLVVKVFAA